MKKKILSVLLFTLLILPTTVFAEEYYRISEYKGNDETLSQTYPGASMTYYPYVNIKYQIDPQTHMGTPVEGIGELNLTSYYMAIPGRPAQSINFSMKITSNELDEEKTYQVTLTSEYTSYNQTYTGAQLNEGQVIVIPKEQTLGTAELTVKEQNTTNKINYKYNTCDGAVGECNPEYAQTQYFNTIEVKFSEIIQQQVSEEFDEIMMQITQNGEIELNAIEPQNDQFTESIITAALQQKYNFPGYIIYGASYDGVDQITIQSAEDPSNNQTYQVEYKYMQKNDSAAQIVNDVLENLIFTRQEIESNFNKRFIVEDLESINYIYNIQKTEDEMVALNSMVNYSSKIHELAGNANIDFMFDIRAGGGDSEFYEMVMGPMNILYKGVIYNNIDPIGYSLSKIIYVPNDTEKTRDAFIQAAKQRINNYLKGIDVQITYGGRISDLDEVQYSWVKYNESTDTETLEHLFDMENTTGEWYNVEIGEQTYKYFIVADSEKMNTPFVKTKDVNTNIYVTTDAFDAPLDSRLNANKLDKDTDEYKALESKLNIIKGLAFDLNLYSTSLDMYISKLSNGNFKVYIPVDEELTKKSLIAAYIKDDGTIEEHEIKFENGYAVFETNHFSTYAIIEKTSNPKTGDNITKYVSILMISMLGLGITIYNNKETN